MRFEPLGGRRRVKVDRSTTFKLMICLMSFAKWWITIYPDAEVIVLVDSTISTRHKPASLYEAFEPAEATAAD